MLVRSLFKPYQLFPQIFTRAYVSRKHNIIELVNCSDFLTIKNGYACTDYVANKILNTHAIQWNMMTHFSNCSWFKML